MVFVKVLNQDSGEVQLQTLHGRADVEAGKLAVAGSDGLRFTVPHTALPNILPNDGTDILKDCEYYVLVKVDRRVGLGKPDYLE